MKKEDTSTLTLGPLDTLASQSSRLPLIPALTILWHPDIGRVGQIAPLTDLLEQDQAVLKRDGPIFYTPGSTTGSPIQHRAISREAVVIVESTAKAFDLRKGPADLDLELDGEPLATTRRLSSDDLARGLILTVGRRVVFCLHAVRFPIARSPDLGLLGSGDAIEEVRRSVLRVAPRDTSVLVRGQSGTGKELVAKAIHAQSARAKGPFVDVNMGRLQPEQAAAELFGYEKGAFTGATEARPGFFRAAHGGTLFLDEIGLTSEEIQRSLLRTLEDHRVQALGSAHSRPVDVRLIAATDAALEDLREGGKIIPSFYHRLNSSFTIDLPPLHQRREDIGVLLSSFLKGELKGTGELFRLDPDQGKPWLSARTVAQIALAPWSGNVRAMRGLAQYLAVESSGVADPDTRAMLRTFLSREALKAPARAPQETPPRRASEITKDGLLDALEQCGWNQSAAARALKISRQSLGRRLEAEPDIRRVVEIPFEKLLRDQEACNGNLDTLAKRLGVAPDVLRRRLGARR